MTDKMDVFYIFPDGSAPKRTEVATSQLSDQWLLVCRDILGHYGPVFSINMGGTLSNFDLHLAGPWDVCQ